MSSDEKKGWAWPWILAGLGAIVAAGIGVAVVLRPRGIRNNNPGNLVDNGIDWEGLDEPRNDAGLVQDIEGRLPLLRFRSPFYGIRAMTDNLVHQVERNGYDTITKLVAHYAPSSDHNDEADYRAFLSSRLGIGQDDTIDLGSQLHGLVAAIGRQENGVELADAWSQAVVLSGIQGGEEAAGFA